MQKLTLATFPLSLSMLLLAAANSHAATPTHTFGVITTVASECSVSTNTMSSTNVLVNPASSVSVNCTRGTQYIVTVSPGAVSGFAKSVLPVQTLTSYPTSANSTPGRKAGNASNTDSASSVTQPLIAYGAPPGGAVAGPDAISVAITY